MNNKLQVCKVKVAKNMKKTFLKIGVQMIVNLQGKYYEEQVIKTFAL